MTNIDLTTLHLSEGCHEDPTEGMCLMEAVAFVAGEPHTDRPACVSPVLGSCGRRLNDVLSDDQRQRLVAFIPRLLGTAGDGRDEVRSYLALDWLIRIATPAWLDLRPELAATAAELRSLPQIVDQVTAEAALPTVLSARDRSRAAQMTPTGAYIPYTADMANVVSYATSYVHTGATAVAAVNSAANAANAAAVAAGTSWASTLSQFQADVIELFDAMITPQL